jgi:hypothetical protein
MTPDIEAAIADVRAAAAEFGTETSHFANGTFSVYIYMYIYIHIYVVITISFE